MRPARAVRLVFRIFLLTCTLSLSVVSILGGLSAINILMNPENINLDFDSISYYVNSSEPSDSYLNLPFSITNDGYFELTDISVYISINLVYNATYKEKNVFRGNKTYKDIKKTETRHGNFNATPLNDLPPGIFTFQYFELNFTLSAWYSLKLLKIEIEIIDRRFP